MRHPPRLRSPLSLSLLATAVALSLFAGCGRESTSPTAPASGSSASRIAVQGLATAVRADIARTIDVQNRATPDLLRHTGVIGSGTSVDEQGNPMVLVYTDRPGVSGIAASLEGVPTRVMMVGKVIAYAKPVRNSGKPGGGSLQMGTSTGNDNECASGTLSCVVAKSGTEYFLSNNHVFARENAASIGERIDAPGRYDGKPRCAQTPQIGTLSDYRAISFSGSNVVDCAITRPSSGVTYSKTEAGGYQPATSTVAASVGLACKKTGRTSGLTTGSVQAINVTIQVQYTAGVATFTNQVQFPGSFIRSGDSGSLAVTASGNNPVALMFAGGSGGSFGNPIGSVLSALGVAIAP
jgi:hypothetical protein